MKLNRAISVAVASLLIAPSPFADTTVRYKFEMKFAAYAQALAPAMDAVAPKIPSSTVIQIKGKLGRTSGPAFASVSDFDKQVITVIDAAHHQYATVYMKDYQDQVASALEGAAPNLSADARKFMESMQSSFTSEKTGKTDKVAGIEVEETEMVLTVSMPPKPNATPSNEAQAAGDPQELMKMIVHLWTAAPSEIDRVAALKEFVTVYGDPSANVALKPLGSIEKVLGNVGGMGNGVTSLLQALDDKKTTALRMNFEIYEPMVAKLLAARSQDKGADQAQAADPDAPFMVVTTEVDTISDAPIDAAVFSVPKEYQLVSVPELLKANLPAPQAVEPQVKDAATPDISAAPKAEAAHTN